MGAISRLLPENAETAARWNNNLQALAEALEPGIPVNISSDPRHGSDAGTEYNAGAGGDISMWPEALGLAATFDPELARTFGRVVAKEYRALGITTALSPQIDLATDPRWGRFLGTFGEDPELAKDFAKAVVEGYQTADDGENENGWGQDSIVAMVKHWPGGGTGEGGRDAHFGCGNMPVPRQLGAPAALYGRCFPAGRRHGKAAAVMPTTPFLPTRQKYGRMWAIPQYLYHKRPCARSSLRRSGLH